MGSGNMIHNLRSHIWEEENVNPYDWAIRFEIKVKTMMLNGDLQSLVHYENLGHDAELSIPTPDHYLPLLYVLATRREDEPITFPIEGIDGGSLSMLTVRIG